MVCTLQTQLANIWLHKWPCLSASAWTTAIVPFVCVVIKKNRGENIKEREKENPQCYSLMTPIVLLSPTLFFLFWWGGWEEGRNYFCQVWGTNVAGELWGGAVLGVLAHVWSGTYWAPIGQIPCLLPRLRPYGRSFWQNGTSVLEIRAFSTRQGSAFKTHNTKL